jgi:hypothetical protein
MRVTNDVPLGSPLLTDATMNCVKTLKAQQRLMKGKTKSPFKSLPGSEGGGDSGAAVKEVLDDTPWFVGKTPRAQVEAALEVGLAGDYVRAAPSSSSSSSSSRLTAPLSATPPFHNALLPHV